MIRMNTYKFAESEKEFINSLFDFDGSCYGYAKRTKRTIKLFDHHHNIFGVINQERVLGTAVKLDNGKIWYSYGTPEIFNSANYIDIQNMIEMLAIDHDTKGLVFK